jgi:dTMP kinase
LTLIRCNSLSIIIYLNRKDIIFMAFFITFEGVEGSGKSTQIRLLRERFAQRGQQVLVTREPGGCPIADAIRAILLDPGNHGLVPRAELLLYAAARAQHIDEIVRPALAAGRVVLCDRFADATTAYQGGGRGLDGALVAQLNTVATAGLVPDLTLLLDVPVEIGLARAKSRGLVEDRFERDTIAFHLRVREAYLERAALAPARYRVIAASRPGADVRAAIESAIGPLL